jgi:hypothetical protein
MARLQTTLQLLRGALLDIIVVTSRHRAAVDERRALICSDAGRGFLFREVGHVVRSRARPKIQVQLRRLARTRFAGNRGGGRNIT